MKNKLLLLTIFTIAALMNSCNSPTVKIDAATATLVDTSAGPSKFTAAMVDNKRDPSCGMPVSAEIGDTAHYKNKVIGFCSKECKDEFLKNPGKNIAAADLKK
jgi:YHS domain-containing protein